MTELGRVVLPDGLEVRLAEWQHCPLFSATAHFLNLDIDEVGPVLVQPGYTVGLGPDGDDVPEPITLDALAQRAGVSPWTVRRNVEEFRALEHKEEARRARRKRARRARCRARDERCSDRVYVRLLRFLWQAKVG